MNWYTRQLLKHVLFVTSPLWIALLVRMTNLRKSDSAALDVERLAEARWNVEKRNWEEKGADWGKWADERNQSIWLTEAEETIVEYARLALSA